jgi:Domain of unknown function (DUF6799)
LDGWRGRDSGVYCSVMKQVTLRGLVIIEAFLAANGGLLCARGNTPSEEVTCRTNTTLIERGGEWTPLESKLAMPGGVEVFTNGTFRVKEGTERQLKEGQILRADGYLLNPDGSTTPVFDHIVMKGARVMVFKDGKGAALSEPLTLPDGSVINPDGTYWHPAGSYGRRSRLVDGQLLTLKGAPMQGLDTISFRNGRVVVYKSGALIPLQSPNLIIGMYDGTRVRGDGLVTFRDGRTTQMTEGQVITVPGVRAEW